MRVFVSWSGATSKALAEAVTEWLPKVIQSVRPFFSPDGIAKGSRWHGEIAKELENSHIGLLVVTRENMQAPWMLFEAGALAKSVAFSKIVPILFDLPLGDLEGPLAQFQSASFSKDEMKRLVRMINSELGNDALSGDSLDSSFNVWWPLLEDRIHTLKGNTALSYTAPRQDSEMLIEILSILRARSFGVQQVEKKESEERRVHSEADSTLSRSEVMRRYAAGVSLSGANLVGVDLSSLNLSGCVLRGSDLVGADLSGVDLTRANLRGANLERATLDGADIAGTDLSYSNLWRASLRDIKNVQEVGSIKLANLYDVKGLNVLDQLFVSASEAVSLGDYPSFVAFYKSRLLSKEEFSEMFLWLAHPRFNFLREQSFGRFDDEPIGYDWRETDPDSFTS